MDVQDSKSYWSQEDEKSLLAGLQKFGLYKWKEVARSIGVKTPVEARQHFKDAYCCAPTHQAISLT